MANSTNNVQLVREQINNWLVPPAGWQTTEEFRKDQTTAEDEKRSEDFVFRNLPLAAKDAEALVEKIDQYTSIAIEEYYLRVEEDTTFHILLLVSASDFHAPQMARAQLLAEDCTRNEERFDIHFTFSIHTEYLRKSALFPNDYKLMHPNAGLV